MAITIERFRSLFPKCNDVKGWVDALNTLLPKYNIISEMETNYFLAQYGYETQGCTRLVENTNYTTEERLMKVFPNKFPSLTLAKLYVNKPVNIANRVYANRYGNGDENSGDGYRYRGRGACHLTFKDNYASFAKDTGVDAIQHPEILEQVWYAVLAGCWYWNKHNCKAFVDKQDMIGLTKIINGGDNGLADRIALLKKIQGA